MSAKKVTDAKIPEDNESDSGFLSGALVDPLPLDSGEISSEMSSEVKEEVKSDEKKVPIVRIESEFDSGVVDVTNELSSCSLDPETVLPAPHTITRTTSVLPPLSVLFKQDNDGDTQLHIAASHGCERAMSILIKVCPNKEWFNIPNDDGHTALHLVVLSRNPVATRMLVIAGASLAVRDRTGETPLHKATSLKNVECLKALLNPVRELPQRRHTAVLNQKNYNGQACIHLAAAAGHVETLQTLLYYGADINLKENLAGWSALHLATQRGQAAAVQYLWPRAQAGARDFAGRTPRRLARRNEHMRKLFASLHSTNDSESDSDDDEYDSDSEAESLFEQLQSSLNPGIMV